MTALTAQAPAARRLPRRRLGAPLGSGRSVWLAVGGIMLQGKPPDFGLAVCCSLWAGVAQVPRRTR